LYPADFVKWATKDMADRIADLQMLEETSGKVRELAALRGAEMVARPAATSAPTLPAILQRAKMDIGQVTPAEVLFLQQTIGNQQVQRLLAGSVRLQRATDAMQFLSQPALPRLSFGDDRSASGRSDDVHEGKANQSVRTVASSAPNFLTSSPAVQRRSVPERSAPSSNEDRAVSETPAPESVGQGPILRQTLPGPLPPPSLFPPRQGPSLIPGMLFEWHLTPQDRTRIVDYLRLGHLAVGMGLRPVFNGQPTNLDAVIDLARTWVLSAVPRDEVARVVRAIWSPMLLEAATRVLPPPPPPFDLPLPPPAADGPAAADDDLQASLGYQWTWHASRRAPSESTVQVQLAQGSGATQRVYSFSVNLTTGDAQAMAGVQFQQDTPTVNFLRGVLKATAFLQLVGGITRSAGEGSGALTFQVQGGVQATQSWGPANHPTVTVTVGVAPTVTFQQGQSAAVDLNLFGQGGQGAVAGPPMGGFVPLVSGTF
jgi:hypothetical protein